MHPKVSETVCLCACACLHACVRFFVGLHWGLRMQIAQEPSMPSLKILGAFRFPTSSSKTVFVQVWLGSAQTTQNRGFALILADSEDERSLVSLLRSARGPGPWDTLPGFIRGARDYNFCTTQLPCLPDCVSKSCLKSFNIEAGNWRDSSKIGS